MHDTLVTHTFCELFHRLTNDLHWNHPAIARPAGTNASPVARRSAVDTVDTRRTHRRRMQCVLLGMRNMRFCCDGVLISGLNETRITRSERCIGQSVIISSAFSAALDSDKLAYKFILIKIGPTAKQHIRHTKTFESQSVTLCTG